jgi:hypothetical protein
MSVRCKFRCHFKENHVGGTIIKMSPVYGGSDENKAFFAATPGGDISFYTVNKDAADQVEQGKDYYIDITPAE